MAASITASGTVAQVLRDDAEAQKVVRRLRSAGFPDVRVSERAGETTEAHVVPEAGLTEVDFEESLRRGGFDPAAARAIALDVARGGILITIAAGERSSDALAVLRGESVSAPLLHPADHGPVPVDAEAFAVPVRRELPADLER
jgi:hypothetical protein